MENDHWNDCINSILNMLEELLVHNHKMQSKASIRNIRKTSILTGYPDSCWMPSITNIQHRKRLRGFGTENRNRKILRASNMESTFTNRSINMNISEISTNNNESYNGISSMTSQNFNMNNDITNQRIIANPILKTKLKPVNNNNHLRFNYPNNIKSQLNKWLQQFNNSNNININAITKNINSNHPSFCTRQQQLESDMKKIINQLKAVHDQVGISSTNILKEHLFAIKQQLFLFFNASSEWMEINNCYSLEKLFQDWPLIEDYLYGLMGYVKAHEEMLQMDVIQRSDDLLTDINNLQMTIDKSAEIYGTQLSSNGYLWKEMGWWVDDSLLNSTKYWYSTICNGVHEEIYNEIMNYGHTENSMNCIASGLELITSINKFIGGSVNTEQMKSFKSLIMIYTQWILQHTESNNEYQLSDLTHYQRMSLHYLQFIDNESRVLNAFNSLVLDYKKHQTIYSSESLMNELSMMSLPSLLVNIIFNIVTLINQQSLPQNQLNIKRSNIMRTTFLPLLYLEKSLVSLTKSTIALSTSIYDSNRSYEQRVQWLSNLLDDAS